MKEKRHIIYATLFLLICFICGYSLVRQASGQTDGIIVLKSGWSISKNGEEPKPQVTRELSDYTFSSLKKGDTLVLSRSLSDLPFEEGTLVLDTWHVVLSVYLDGDLLYTRGQEYTEAGQMVGNLRHYVTLPEGYQQKQLYLYMTCTENDAMSGILPVGIADGKDVSVYWFNRLFPLFIPAVIVLCVGMVVILIGLLLVRKNDNTSKIPFLGAMLLLVGVYSLCRGQFISMMIPNPQVYNGIEFFSVYWLPVTIVGLFFGDRKKIKYNWIKKIYYAIFSVTLFFAAGTTVLHIFNICHYSAFLPLFYVVIILGVAMLYVVVRNIMEKDQLSMKLYFFSVIMVMVGATLAVFAFRLRFTVLNEVLHIWKWQEYLFIMFLFAAGFLAASALIIETGEMMYNSMYASMYKQIAYTDALTGLGNRRKFDEELQGLEKKKGKEIYHIVCFDLNDLKLFNDTMGHDTGDILLKSFAQVLQNACEEDEYAYRIGGDEYAAILHNGNSQKAEAFMMRIQQGIEEANRRNRKITISAAYGYASQEENESVHKVDKLADERMYANKAEMKGKRLQ